MSFQIKENAVAACLWERYGLFSLARWGNHRDDQRNGRKKSQLMEVVRSVERTGCDAPVVIAVERRPENGAIRRSPELHPTSTPRGNHLFESRSRSWKRVGQGGPHLTSRRREVEAMRLLRVVIKNAEDAAESDPGPGQVPANPMEYQDGVISIGTATDAVHGKHSWKSIVSGRRAIEIESRGDTVWGAAG